MYFKNDLFDDIRKNYETHLISNSIGESTMWSRYFFKLIRTDTTVDLSQNAEKVMKQVLLTYVKNSHLINLVTKG